MTKSKNILKKAKEAVTFIQRKLDKVPEIVIITGTGLSDILANLSDCTTISYDEIPYFPKSTVPSHKNKIVVGTLGGTYVMTLIGRFHYYEGYSMDQITFPIRVLQALGVKRVMFTNATGGLNENYKDGTIVLVKDHIYLMPENPLRGINDDLLGPRFPDMSQVYDPFANKKLQAIAKENNIEIFEGVYACWQGPSLETPAEYSYLHHSGADLIGMSTIPEVIVAVQAEMKITVISVVTNVCFPPSQIQKTSIADVVAVAQSVTPKIQILINNYIQSLTN